MRMIVVFEKAPVLRHVGHLDLMRNVQRALRRSTLPIRYSQGYNPHILLSFAAPLSVGVIGRREIMDVPLIPDVPVTEQAFTDALNTVFPSALRVIRSRLVEDNFPTLMSLVAGSRIRIEVDAGSAADDIAAIFPRFMAATECITLRKTKSGENMTNIRPFVAQANVTQTADGYTLQCVIANRAEGALKPAVLMQCLCEMAAIDSAPYIAYRDAILAQNQEGALIALEDYAHG